MRGVIVLPMSELLNDAIWLELYEEPFVKELYEMAFYVYNRMNDTNLLRVGIRYTLSAAIDEEIVTYVNSEPEFAGYLAKDDYRVIFDIILQAYHYINWLLTSIGLDISEQEVTLTPHLWVTDRLLVRVHPM